MTTTYKTIRRWSKLADQQAGQDTDYTWGPSYWGKQTKKKPSRRLAGDGHNALQPVRPIGETQVYHGGDCPTCGGMLTTRRKIRPTLTCALNHTWEGSLTASSPERAMEITKVGFTVKLA